MTRPIILAIRDSAPLLLGMLKQVLAILVVAGVIAVTILLSACGGSGGGNNQGTTTNASPVVGQEHIQKETKP